VTSDVQPDKNSKKQDAKLGVVHKPLVEQLKLLGLFALIGALIYYSRPQMPSFGFGLALVVIGTLIRVWAAGHLTRDQKLTTSGPYQYSRNPFYLGRFLLIIGFALMSGLSNNFSDARNVAVWVIFMAALLIFFVYYMPRKEAREGGRLAKLFGPDYEMWKANVPSLFPRLTPYVMHPKPWSRELFMGGDEQHTGNKELWTTLVVIGLIGLFIWRMQTLGG
jgi:protein-S-isoprenylcysteine O-methyltransferase Ste14